jgi:hypothetical protein
MTEIRGVSMTTLSEGTRPGAVVQWYRDPVSCLQTTLATLLIHAGEKPLDSLGLAWEFLHVPGDVPMEEYYWPCRYPYDLARSVLPHHPVRSRWHEAPAADPVSALEGALAEGRLPVVAVDNYHLPFRPAYHDVHSAHLIVVYEVDRSAGTVGVSDVMPPAFLGPLRIEDLVRAWRSELPRDVQNSFFSGAGVARTRWLDVRFLEPFAELTPARLSSALSADVRRFTEPADEHAGLSGLAEYTGLLLDRARAGDGDALRAAYTFGWATQAQSALHGELLRRCGSDWGVPGLVEAGRRVERVAHCWTGLRVAGAHGRTDPHGWLPELTRHVHRLHRIYQEAVESVDRVAREL